MPKLRVGSQADSADNRTNLFIPVGMDAMVETEIYGTISCSSRKTLTTFGKEQRDSTILVANVKPYLKSQRALSPTLQESPSASTSPTKIGVPPDLACPEPKEERDVGSDSSAYGPPDGQCSPLHTELEEPSYLTCELRPKSLSSCLIHSSVISQECGGSDCEICVLDWCGSFTQDMGVWGSVLIGLQMFPWCTVHVRLDVCILHNSSSDYVSLLKKLLLLRYESCLLLYSEAFCLHLVYKDHYFEYHKGAEIHIK
ncbi:hypothetical protein XENOCAPTIV_017398 [Xenoophorus captivus]|uniref:Uncharacterized protein n=1 Tax=Xenoophorus captivus TaxID=1517983 RepID=A0ABV0QAH6_9TELE